MGVPNIVLCRIDNRLVHGQVGITWLSHSKANLILVADDDVAQDEQQQTIMRLTAEFYGAQIMAGICASLAIEGSMMGPAVYFVVYILVFLSKYFFVHAGYRMGTASISKLGEQTKDLSTAASILGCTVIGGLIATLVSFSLNVTVKITQDTVISLQEAIFDNIIPGLLPPLITVLMYVLIKKKTSPTVLIVGMLIVCLALSFFGIV